MIFYSNYASRWCYGLKIPSKHVKDDNAQKLDNFLCQNGLGNSQFMVLSGSYTNNINIHNNSNYNFIITCSDRLKLENLIHEVFVNNKDLIKKLLK